MRISSPILFITALGTGLLLTGYTLLGVSQAVSSSDSRVVIEQTEHKHQQNSTTEQQPSSSDDNEYAAQTTEVRSLG